MTPIISAPARTTAGNAGPGVSARQRAPRPWAPRRLAEPLKGAGFALGGFASLMLLWALIASFSADLPTPSEAWATLRTLLSSPFHDNGPNDKGIGVQLWVSLQRVFMGFALAAVVAIPVGFLIGASRRLFQAFNPIVQLLRPVSPLAWFPIGLVVFKDAPMAAVFVIFITALWPTIINTAFGVASVPEDHKNVARVFQFSRYSYVRHVLAPYALPSILTGMRISMGIAWMVIVAVEMLSGGTGIGFFIWDSYNASNLAQVSAAIFLIGATGLLLDMLFNKAVAMAQYEEGRS